jgi:hypothetical protein
MCCFLDDCLFSEPHLHVLGAATNSYRAAETLLAYQPRDDEIWLPLYSHASPRPLSYLIRHSLSTLSVNEVLPSCGDTLYYTLSAQLYLQPQPVRHTEHPLTHIVKHFPSKAPTYRKCALLSAGSQVSPTCLCAKSNSKVKMSKMHWWDGKRLTGEAEVLAHELSQPVPVSSCSPQTSALGSKPDLRGDRAASDRLSNGTVHSYFGLNAFVTKNTVSARNVTHSITFTV